jgi:thiamine-phosphate pyrophosphorylase
MPVPLVGIGGITADNAGEVVAAGADAVAVISAVCGAPDPEAATRRLIERLEDARARAVPRRPRLN